MRTFFLTIIMLSGTIALAQDTLKTTALDEVVVTGTKYELSQVQSGKTITKLTAADLAKNSGKTLGDILNEIPGIQIDGNFSTPGSNLSYYVRGGRNKNTLVLIDGVPLNDPSAINAEYDLRYIPLSQIESIEVLKGSLSTLYGTGASAGVINIILKKGSSKKFSAEIDLNAASYETFGQSLQVGGTNNKVSYYVSANNVTSEGFSSAQDNDEAVTFDKDGFSRQNVLAKVDVAATERFSIGVQTAYEQFDADFDAYEFTDADNSQRYNQTRLGITPTYLFNKGQLTGKFFYNQNNREFKGDFPSELMGRNFQAEVIHRHPISESLQILSGLNFQSMAFEENEMIAIDTARFTIFDPYTSIMYSAKGFSVHAGIRLNTHSEYGSAVVYNVNPSYVFNENDASFKLKVYASYSTAYITPSLYQLYSYYGNKDLEPEESENIELGATAFVSEKAQLSVAWFSRSEDQLIEFFPMFDDTGNYIGGKYVNFDAGREVQGVEVTASWNISKIVRIGGNFTSLSIEDDPTFYKIPKQKFGVNLDVSPVKSLELSLKYNFTGPRDAFDFTAYEEVSLDSYQLVDLFASYSFIGGKLTAYAAVNNVLDENFIGVLGYTTRGRNYAGGVRYRIR